MGGPIRKNKTFFFGGYEGTRQINCQRRRRNLIEVVPTAWTTRRQFRFREDHSDPTTGLPFPNNIIPESRLSPIATAITDEYIPTPNYATGGATNFFASGVIPTNMDQYTARMDHRFGDSDSIYGRWFDSCQKDLSPFTGACRVSVTHANRKKDR